MFSGIRVHAKKEIPENEAHEHGMQERKPTEQELQTKRRQRSLSTRHEGWRQKLAL